MVSTKIQDTKGCQACCVGERESRGYSEGSGARGMTWTVATEEGCRIKAGCPEPGERCVAFGGAGQGRQD